MAVVRAGWYRHSGRQKMAGFFATQLIEGPSHCSNLANAHEKNICRSSIAFVVMAEKEGSLCRQN